MARSTRAAKPEDFDRYGLKYSLDVELYMKTPEGQAVASIIQQEEAAIESIQHASRSQEKQAQLRRHRFLIALLLSFIEEKAHAKQKDSYVQEEIERILQQLYRKKQEESEELQQYDTHGDVIETALQIYDDAIKSIDADLQNKKIEIQDVEKDLVLLEQALPVIEARYDRFDAELNDVDFDQVPHMKTHIKDIQSKMTSYALITSRLLHEGKETEADEQQEKTYALSMKAEMLNRLHQAHIQERHLFNRQAERVYSLREADFFVPHNRILTLDKGQYYLHSHEKDWSVLSQTERHEAKQAYRDTFRDLMSIKMQLQLQRAQAIAHNQHQHTALVERREGLKQDMHVLGTLLTKVQDMRQTLQQIPRPTPGFNPSNLAQQRQLQQKMAMAIQPNANAMDIQQLIAPQNTGSTAPATAPTPFRTTPTPRPIRGY